MDADKILYYTDRNEFRQWLAENHDRATECWVTVKKGRPTDEPCLYYLDAVEEALCFGWIDSTNRTHEGRTVQRFSPRKKGSPWSELNMERCRRLERLHRMTEAGRRVWPPPTTMEEFAIDADIQAAFEQHPDAWRNFCRFPELYRRIRIDTIQRDKRKDLALFRKRLERLVQKSEQGEMFGDWNDYGRLLEHTKKTYLMKIDHLALWCDDLEVMKAFYCRYFGCTANALYHNPRKAFHSYFLSFEGSDCRIELMTRPDIADEPARRGFVKGIAHFDIIVGSEADVDALTERLRADGYTIAGEPRHTGDGYYESAVLDPEGNYVELSAEL